MIYLSLGSNQGDRRSLLKQATDLIRERVGSVVCCSPVYETEPWGTFREGEDQPFLNVVLAVETGLSPEEVLTRTQAIEKELGRVRPQQSSRQYASRPIDIDLLLCGSTILNSQIYTINSTPSLVLPHPRMHLRRFVLQPLCDIAPQAIHPVLNKTVQQLLDECPDTSLLSCCS